MHASRGASAGRQRDASDWPNTRARDPFLSPLTHLLPPLGFDQVPPQLRQLSGALVLHNRQQLGPQPRQCDRAVGLLAALLRHAHGQA